MPILSCLEQAQAYVRQVVAEGDTVVDATVGNGVDTAFLADLVGAGGHVYGFDVQAQALDAAKGMLRDSGLVEQVTLFESGHECLRQVLPSDALGRTKAVMFNLGYWPGHRRDVMTKPHTTLEALKQTLEVLVQGGVVTVVMYSGHEGAGDESQGVLEWAAGLAQKQFHVVSYRRTNQQNNPPQLLAIEKQ